MQYLQGNEIARKLVEAGALEGAAVGEVPERTLKVNWDALLRDVEPVTKKLNKIFLR
jgi:hypothetical protein